VRLTVIGARGFVGSALEQHARLGGLDVVGASHDRIPKDSLGTVIYCSGLACGASERPLEAFRLHVCVPIQVLSEARYDRFIYVSSTRVYDTAIATNEDVSLPVQPLDVRSTYATSKSAGEAAVLSASANNVVVRLSNVFGPQMRSNVFLNDILHQAVSTGRIELRTALDSSKDYIAVDDVADLLLRIASAGTQRVYNLAAGYNTTHAQLTRAIAATLPVEVVVVPGAPLAVAPTIDIGRVRREFKFTPRNVVEAMPAMLRALQEAR
jgi:nucleoside-diphosphate-sugar epimerase